MPFDPNAAASQDSGIFGLPNTADDAQVILVPVPFDATTSYQAGAALGPAAVLRASKQVDLLDHHFGKVYERGIYLETEPDSLVKLFGRARVLAEPIIAKGGAEDSDARAIAEINRVGAEVNDLTYGSFAALLSQGKSPGLLGGDHSTPFGSISACADLADELDPAPLTATGKKRGGKGTPPRGGLGVLHLDAHMDLRDTYEGFQWSHASIMHNVMSRVPEVHALVQIGIRDYSEGEIDAARCFGGRVHTFFDADWSREMLDGVKFSALVKRALALLPKYVYVSFDIDALDPSLCPHTGTPVPGGLSFNQAATILRLLADSGRTVLGFDLVEVAPGRCDDEPELDANVGARMLYKLSGLVGERRLDPALLRKVTVPASAAPRVSVPGSGAGSRRPARSR